MLVRVTLVWRLWQWDATKKTQWESVQACLWFPYNFFFRIPLEIRYNLNSFSSKSVVPNFIAGSSPAKKFRQVFLDGCHARLFWKVKSDPMPFESKTVPTEGSAWFPRILVAYGSKNETSTPLSTGSKFMSDFITDFSRADKNLQCWKTMFFFSPITLQRLNSPFLGNSKH